VKIALTGGAYQAHSVIASAQRSLNLFAEPLPQQQGEPMPMAHYPTPGLRLLSTLPEGPVRGIRQVATGAIYAVAGNGVYQIDPNTWAGTLIGTIGDGLKTPVSMADNGLDLVIVNGTSSGWDVTLSNNTFTLIPTTDIVTPVTASTTAAITAGTARYTSFTTPLSGSISMATVSLGAGYTGNLQAAIFADAGGAPGAAVGLVANTLANPVAGSNTLLFGTPITVTQGTQYWLGFDSDTTGGTWSVAAGTTGLSSTTAYADFPAASPATTAAAAVVASVSVSNDPQGMFSGADRVDYLDTYLIFNKPGTPQFYISGSLAITFDSLDFANKESYSDLLITLIVARRLIYLLGERTTEIWYDSGAVFSTSGSDASTVASSGFQFSQLPSVFVDHGCAAKYSAANYDNGIYWLTRDRQGHGIVMKADNYVTTRVSTFAIEAEIAGYARIDDAIGFCYQLAGHSFYVLTFPHADHTWCYDITTKEWHEWAWIDSNGTEHRHRANCYWACNGTPVVGDWQNGNLYALDNTVFTDNGAPIKRVRSYPHLLADGKRVFYQQFLADIECGEIAETDAPQQISLRWSDDRGHSYGNPLLQPSGNTGEYLTSMQFQRLGMARDRVFEISWSVPAKLVLQGAWIDATPGTS
jgi:Phage stabilisation protein